MIAIQEFIITVGYNCNTSVHNCSRIKLEHIYQCFTAGYYCNTIVFIATVGYNRHTSVRHAYTRIVCAVVSWSQIECPSVQQTE